MAFSAGCGDSKEDKATVALTVQEIVAAAATAGDQEDAAAEAALEATATAEAAKTYTGDRKLTGTVDTGSLSSSDRNLVSARANRTTKSTTATTTAAVGSEIVKLYVLNSNGDMKDTGITCSVTSGAYSCPGIEGGLDYIVRYVKQLDSGKILEMTSSATVPSDADPAPVKIDPVTTMIAEAIVKAVSESLAGLISNEALVQDIITSVKTAVSNVMTTLVQTGVIQIPSLVKDGDLDIVEDVVTENTELAEATGLALTDSSVTDSLVAAKSEAEATAIGDLTKRQKIAAIFKQMMGGGDGGDVPSWIVKFLGDKWNSLDSNMTIAWLSQEMVNSMEVESRELTEREIMEETAADALAAAIEAKLVAGIVTNTTAWDEAKAAITEYHTTKAIALADRTAEQQQFMSEFPRIVGELFPTSFLSTADVNTAFQNSGQLTAYLIYLLDVYSKDIVEEELTALVDAGTIELFGDQARHMHLVDFNPEFLFMALGFNETIALQYAGIEINNGLNMRTESFWDQDTQTETEYMTIRTGFSDTAWMFAETPPVASDFTVTLTYPKADGTRGSASLTPISYSDEGDDEGSEEFELEIRPYDWDESTHEHVRTSDPLITDYATGDYNLSVAYSGKTVSRVFKNIFVLQNARDRYPSLISPKEFPRWPGDNASDAEREAHHAEWQEFQADGGATIFAPNSEDNSSLTGAIFKWKEANVSGLNLPENVVAGYYLSISRFEAADEDEANNCYQGRYEDCSTEIYNSWEDDGRAIRGTSFTLPIPLPVNNVVEEPAKDEYNIGIHLAFIDKKTGREVAKGGDSWTSFTVGQPKEVLSDAADINFSGTVSMQTGSTEIVLTTLKAAILSESHTQNDDGDWVWSTQTIATAPVAADGTYDINITVGTVKAAIADKKHIGLVVFQDTDNDGSFDNWTPETNTGEQAWWMMDTGIWFEDWGDFRVGIHRGNGDGDYSSKKVTNAGLSIDDMDFEIWNYNN